MNILLCQMMSMDVVSLVFKIDILKMEHAFHMGCKEGDKVFYLFLTAWRGEEDTIDKHEKEWNVHWQEDHDRFDSFLIGNFDIQRFSRHMFFNLGWKSQGARMNAIHQTYPH